MLSVSIQLAVIILLLVYGIIVLKRHLFEKKPFKGGTEAAALNPFSKNVSKDKQAGIENIQYFQKEELEDKNGKK